MAPQRTRDQRKQILTESLSPSASVKNESKELSSPVAKKTQAAVKMFTGVKPKKARNPINDLQRRGTIESKLDFTRKPLASETKHVFVFGTGDFGQFGLGTETFDEIKRPRAQKWFEEKIDSDKNWAQGVSAIACGGMHTLAVDANGNVWSWGINDNAALGRKTVGIENQDSDELESVPMEVEFIGPPDFPVNQVYAGDSISIAVSEEGMLKCWGSFRESEGLMGFGNKKKGVQFEPVQLPGLTAKPVTNVACGTDHFLALTDDGFVYACGNGEQGQLGRKILSRHKGDGMRVERLILGKPSNRANVVGCGSYHSFAVTTDGEVYGWGLNSFHQLGISTGANEQSFTPLRIPGLSPSEHNGARVVKISAGEHHSLFLFSNGEIWACGRSDSGQLGLAETNPAIIEMNRIQADAQIELEKSNAEKVVKREQIIAQFTDPTDPELAYSLESLESEPGNFVMPPKCVPEPTKVDFGPPAGRLVSIASGTQCSYAIDENGKLFSWGEGPSSQLGLGDLEQVNVPTQVVSKQLNGYDVVAVSGGGQHAMLLAVKNGEVKQE